MSYIKHRDGLSPAFVTIHDSFLEFGWDFHAVKPASMYSSLGSLDLRVLDAWKKLLNGGE